MLQEQTFLRIDQLGGLSGHFKMTITPTGFDFTQSIEIVVMVILGGMGNTLGVILAAMNTLFYEAIARLPLATVGAIEFLGPIALAAFGVRTRRNLAALVLAAGGVHLLTEVRIAGAASPGGAIA